MSRTQSYTAWLCGLSLAERNTNSDGVLRRRWMQEKYGDEENRAWEQFIDRLGEEEADVAKARRRWDSQPDLLKALLAYQDMYEVAQPTGGWQGVYEQGAAAIALAAGEGT